MLCNLCERNWQYFSFCKNKSINYRLLSHSVSNIRCESVSILAQL